jgi:hypothetical protein
MSSPTPQARGKPNSLRRAALLGWVCWLAIAVLLWGQWRLQVVHFHFLPFAALFLGMLAAVVATGVTAMRRWRRGAPRGRTAAWAIAGFLPLVLFAVPCGYAAYQARYAIEPDDLFFKFAVGVAATTMEGRVRLASPNRLETERLVMFYDRLETPGRDTELMDQYVAGLEKTLGRPIRGKIYWVRGPLLGLRATALPGFALGSDASPDWEIVLGNDLDRHELAHAVLYQHLGPDADPPMFFDEGWAESQARAESNPTDRYYVSLAWDLAHQRKIDDVPPLGELVSPEWYHNHRRRKHIHYRVGAPLVAFLIREYGGERFLELYNGCWPETFDADCRRVLGVGVDELERLLERDGCPRAGRGQGRVRYQAAVGRGTSWRVAAKAR